MMEPRISVVWYVVLGLSMPLIIALLMLAIEVGRRIASSLIEQYDEWQYDRRLRR